MTNLEKIYLLKSTIERLYCKEGRSKSYISKLLSVNRKILTYVINHEWKFVQANIKHLSPSKRKFLNKHRLMIKDRLDSGIPLSLIAKELSVSRYFLSVSFIKHDDACSIAYEQYQKRKERDTNKRIQNFKDKSKYTYDPKDLEGEIWHPVLGYEGYMVSNFGRFKSYSKCYKAYRLLTPYQNHLSGYLYIVINRKNLAVHRIVAHTFVSGYDNAHNTVNHKDGNKTNNTADNLEWVSQSENNLHKYRDLKYNPSHKKHYFKEIILNGVYHFKTIRSLAKFLDLSETQAARYLYNHVANNPYDFKIVY